MNERIEGLWWQAQIGYNNQNCDPEVLAKFTQLIVRECANYINTEIDKLHDYKNSLPEYSSHTRRADVDLAIEKCMDNIQGIKKHFGVKELEEDSTCPLCGEDGGTTCGMPGCQY